MVIYDIGKYSFEHLKKIITTDKPIERNYKGKWIPVINLSEWEPQYLGNPAYFRVKPD